MRWRKIGIRSYKRTVVKADAFVFGAHRPECLWAWAVYSKGGQSAGVTNSFRGAKKLADQHIDFLSLNDVMAAGAGNEPAKES